MSRVWNSKDIHHLIVDLKWAVEDALHPDGPPETLRTRPALAELIIVDEADRLKMSGLEQPVVDLRPFCGLIWRGAPRVALFQLSWTVSVLHRLRRQSA